jgi:flagellar protein FlgJ
MDKLIGASARLHAHDALADGMRPAAAGMTPDAATRRQAEEAAVKFESLFILQMLRQMRSTTRALADENSFLNARENEDMLDLADGFVADAMAAQRAFGIADVILRQLLPPAPAGSVAPQAALKLADAAVALNGQEGEMPAPPLSPLPPSP